MIDIASDLWNVFDLIALRPKVSAEYQQFMAGQERQFVLVQVTSSTNHATRRNKIIASSEAKLCLLAGASILIQSWRKKDNRWQYMDEWMTLDQFVFGLPGSVGQFYEDEKRKKLLERGLPPSHTLPLAICADEETPF